MTHVSIIEKMDNEFWTANKGMPNGPNFNIFKRISKNLDENRITLQEDFDKSTKHLLNKQSKISAEMIDKIKQIFELALELNTKKFLEIEKNLPDLKGSEKQILWANEIRKQVIAMIDNSSSGLCDETEETENIKKELAFSNLKLIENAKFFIDEKKYNNLDGLVNVNLRRKNAEQMKSYIIKQTESYSHFKL